MIEKRFLYRDDLRQLCIDKNWFTKGTNEEYTQMLDSVEKYVNIKTKKIEYIAKYILRHSKTEQSLTSICFDIARICYSVFEDETGKDE